VALRLLAPLSNRLSHRWQLIAGTSDSDIFTAQASNGATWVTLVTNRVTPTGAGNYRFTSGGGGALTVDMVGGAVSDNGTFSGNWRIRESDGVTPVVKDSGTFTATWVPELTETEAGIIIVINPAHVEFDFIGLPGVSENFVNTYSGAATDLTFEIQRASGSNDISGLSGSMKTVWS
jgi:hypothetical protein